MSKNKLPCALATTAALVLVARLSYAAAAGATSLDFLRLDIGARQVGMGGAGVGLGGDIYSSAQNPAWLARLEGHEIGLSDAIWLQDITYQDLLYGQSTPYGSFGLRFQNLGYGNIQGYDDAGTATNNFSAGDRLLGLGYGRTFDGPRLSLGAAVKLVEESIGGAGTHGVLADLGAAWSPWTDGQLETMSFGLAVKNIGPAITFDQVSEPLPRTIDLGVGMKFLNNSLQTALDLHFPYQQSPYCGIGGEYWFYHEFAVRAGFETGQAEGPGIRVGFGARVGPAEINYAFLPMGDLGQTHQLSVILRFGGPGSKEFREGVKLMRADKPAEAILKFEEVLRLDPDYPGADEWLRRAHREILNSVEESR